MMAMLHSLRKTVLSTKRISSSPGMETSHVSMVAKAALSQRCASSCKPVNKEAMVSSSWLAASKMFALQSAKPCWTSGSRLASSMRTLVSVRMPEAFFAATLREMIAKSVRSAIGLVNGSDERTSMQRSLVEDFAHTLLIRVFPLGSVSLPWIRSPLSKLSATTWCAIMATHRTNTEKNFAKSSIFIFGN